MVVAVTVITAKPLQLVLSTMSVCPDYLLVEIDLFSTGGKHLHGFTLVMSFKVC